MIWNIIGILFSLVIIIANSFSSYYFVKYPIKEFGNDYVSLGMTFAISFLITVIAILIMYFSAKSINN